MKYELLNPRPEHFKQIQELCLKVYPFSKPWSLAQLESHQLYFPDGQLIVIEKKSKRIVGLAFSLIILWDNYSHQDSWSDFTSNGFFSNHNPRKGKTLYGAEVMVDPELRGQGIGKMLYKGRQKIVEKYNLKRIRAGARLRGYSKYQKKFSPQAYTAEVVQKRIYDPTLSFQLNQGFAAIDVAKNYLFNDPESLGFAAVIEWLNPKVATEADFTAQARATAALLTGERFVPEHISRELRHLVRKSTLTLGRIMAEAEGEGFLKKVEHYREKLKRTRTNRSKKLLSTLANESERETPANKSKLAHAFALHLELVNCCETAYRTWRIRQRPLPTTLKAKVPITLVLTAHPTEARSAETLVCLKRMTELLINALNNQMFFDESELESILRLLWVRPLTSLQKPTVEDEARHIYAIALSENALHFLSTEHPNFECHLRTWVGGDKDGHPGVNAQALRSSLQLSRNKILKTIGKKLDSIIGEAENLSSISVLDRTAVTKLKLLRSNLDSLKTISFQDGTRVKSWILKYKSQIKKLPVVLQKHHENLRICRLIELFPALVMRIELREDASLIAKAITEKNAAIRLMLNECSKIAGPMPITSYIAALVISHCESVEDLQRACDLIAISTKQLRLPAVPLFESREALKAGAGILRRWLNSARNKELARRHWNGKVEVMLGYSDSAKQVGVLSSRFLIARAMREIELAIRHYQLQANFFHGSGGSIARGGGSVQEQVAWWTASAVERPKLTVQGEMIQRWFATPEILNSQCTHLANELHRRKRARKSKLSKNTALERFSTNTEAQYRGLVNNQELISKLLTATPYKYLEVLQIGSRPSRRPSEKVSLDSLRAIPWVLCWTQTRSLIPVWWGIGISWKNLPPTEKAQLRQNFIENPFFSSFVKALGFSLAKVELEIWELYLDQINIDKKTIEQIKSEYQLAVQFVFDVTSQNHLIWYRMWLEESIRLRSPQIHILNFLQISAMKTGNEKLMRETMVGISSGMLTTG